MLRIINQLNKDYTMNKKKTDIMVDAFGTRATEQSYCIVRGYK